MQGRPEHVAAPAAEHPDLSPAALQHASPRAVEPARYLLTVLQLGALVLAIYWLELERSFGLHVLAPLVLAGFAVHALLPATWKLPAFLGLSLAAFLAVLGPEAGALLIALALGLVGVCHLPVGFRLRVGLLAAVGLALVATRAEWLTMPLSRSVLPVLGAMFMFRLVIYLYDERTAARPATPWMRLSYFFLLPNVCFLLFPVVDYRTFQRTYYAEPTSSLHARGVQWMLRGVTHLVLYRVVYVYLTPSLSAVEDLYGVVLFVVSSYLLYLRISGHFHLIVGILHLFGFGLPETNHRYLLASSFTDCWRRINIYWTEFMKKIVYFPAFMRLRRGGAMFGMVVATALTFLATWWLHAYQWFWLNGAFPLAMDGAFWGVAGVLALVTTVHEARRGRRTVPEGSVPSWGFALRRSCQALGVFALICVIWSLWCSPTPAQWLATMQRAADGSGAQVAVIAGALAAVVLVGSAAQRLVASPAWSTVVPGPSGTAALRTLGCVAVALLGLPAAHATLGPGVQAALAPLVTESLNLRDTERRIASYYDRLIEREGFGGRVWERERMDPNDVETFLDSAVSTLVETPLVFELAPSERIEFMGSYVETNRWGMRDRDYTRAKPPGTVRIAILGTCYEMGVGVDNDQVWEALAEVRLNRELSPRTGVAYELLNFSVPAYTPLHQVLLVRDRLPAFEPDVVLVSNHIGPSVKYLIQVAALGPPYPEGVDEIFERAEVEPGMDAVEVRLRVGPLREWIEDWAFEEMAAACAAMDAVPALMDVPFVEEVGGRLPGYAERRMDRLRSVAFDQGFVHLDLTDAFGDEPYEAVAIPEIEHCPNELGHRLMADRFVEMLAELGQDLGLP